MSLINQFAILALFLLIGILGAIAHYVKKRYGDKTIDCSLWAYIEGNPSSTLKAFYSLFAAEFSLMLAHTSFNWQELGLVWTAGYVADSWLNRASEADKTGR